MEPIDVTVRIPVGFDNAAEAAGFIQASVTEAMHGNNWIGEAVVMWRKDGDGPIIMFYNGVVDPYDGVLPHGLSES